MNYELGIMNYIYAAFGRCLKARPKAPLFQFIIHNSKFIIFLVPLVLILPSISIAKDQVKYSGPSHVTVQDSVSLRDIKQTTFRAPESLVFNLYWRWLGIRWVRAGRATLEVLPHEKPGLWRIQSRAWANSFFQKFYPVSDTIFSVIDSAGIYPVHFEKNLHEGSYEAHIKSWFNQETHKAWLQDTIIDIEPFTHDILSAFYFIRTNKIEPGKTFWMDAVSGKKKYKLKVVCSKRETIEIPAGKFKCVVVEPKVVDVGLFRAKGRLWIWLTDDEHHTPIRMKSKIPVGSIYADLHL